MEKTEEILKSYLTFLREERNYNNEQIERLTNAGTDWLEKISPKLS